MALVNLKFVTAAIKKMNNNVMSSGTEVLDLCDRFSAIGGVRWRLLNAEH